MSRQLIGKKALVTGGCRGLGRAIALELAVRGADVAVWAMAVTELEQTAALIQGLGRKGVAQVVDVSRISALDAALAATVQSLGGLDILVNNAGVNHPAPALDITEEIWDKIMSVNLKAPFFIAQAAVKYMQGLNTTDAPAKDFHGRIINISSSLSRNVLENRAPYQASKGGINVLTQSLALEWAALGVTVNAVAPAIVDTEMTKSMGSNTAVHPKMLAGRLIRPEEIATAVAFLASDEADMITGQTLFVDAGWSIH